MSSLFIFNKILTVIKFQTEAQK